MTPVKSSSRPIIWRSQSSTRVSISAAAGDVCQSRQFTSNVAVNISANTDGGMEFAGK